VRSTQIEGGGAFCGGSNVGWSIFRRNSDGQLYTVVVRYGCAAYTFVVSILYENVCLCFQIHGMQHVH
jgi:hypothetical protein